MHLTGSLEQEISSVSCRAYPNLAYTTRPPHPSPPMISYPTAQCHAIAQFHHPYRLGCCEFI